MITNENGGMVEYIPTPSEKRDNLIRDHTLGLLANLDGRVRRLEKEAGLPLGAADVFERLMGRIRAEEAECKEVNEGHGVGGQPDFHP